MSDETKDLKDSTETKAEQGETESHEAAPETPKDTGSKGKKRLPIIIGALIAVLAIVYVAGVICFRMVFFPGTTINGLDCGFASSVASAVRLTQQTQQYTLDILGRDPGSPVAGEVTTLATVSADEISLTITDAEARVGELLSQQNEWLWPYTLLISGGAQYELAGVLTYDTQQLSDTLAGYEAFQSRNMTAPENAHVGAYSSQTGTFGLVEDVAGSKLDMEAVYAALDTAIQQEEAQLDLETAGCYVEADITADDEALLANLETADTWVKTEITYDWNSSKVVLDGAQISEWISFEGNEPTLDEEAVAEFVKTNAKEYDTFGKSHKFLTTRGIELTLPNGGYGWKTDRDTETQELIALIKSGAQEDREPVYSSQGWVKGEDDIGDSYVEIDLTFQHLYLYQDGEIVLESDFVSGNVSNGHTTPAGIFGITYKTRNAVLRGDDYETPVSYWMPFNGDVGMHDATWRSSFGGTIYLTSGSHGCVNLPLSSAAAIYEYMETGFPVICYYYPEGTVVDTTDTTDTTTDAATAATEPAAEGETTAESSEAAVNEGEQAQ